MNVYLIRPDQMEKYGIPKDKLDKVFDYLGYEEIATTLEEQGITNISEERLDRLSDIVMTKYDCSHLEDIVEFLKYKGCLK
ncbi:MAG: hypothetical protein ACRCXY_04260 [Fusobacteriaceae bacterium]